MKSTVNKKKIAEKEQISDESFVKKELLLNSMIQQELLITTRSLDKTLKELTSALKVFEKHEYFELHRNKWKLIRHNILLGVLFTFGTVLWLVLLSWLTFNFFKESVILKQIVENQLKIRQFDIGDIREKATNSLMTQTGSNTVSGTTWGEK